MTTSIIEHAAVFDPLACKCGAAVTKDVTFYVCADTGWFLGWQGADSPIWFSPLRVHAAPPWWIDHAGDERQGTPTYVSDRVT